MSPPKQGSLCGGGGKMDPHSHGFSVNYNSESHFQVLFQCHGSVWNRVWPYCLFNSLLCIVLSYAQQVDGFDFRVTDKGHSYMTLLVSFLIVTRVTVTLARFNQVRAKLGQVYLGQRQLYQCMIMASLHDTTGDGKQWRHDLAYYSMLQLRCIMCVIDYQTEEVPGWQLPEMSPELQAVLKSQLFVSPGNVHLAHHSTISEAEENMRVPIRLALLMRQTIVASRTRLSSPMSVNEENKLYACVDGIMTGYYGIRTFLTTPFPFPVVQMARTFLFAYLFTTPFALLGDVSQPVAHCIVVFFLTNGFMGLEAVAMELDDPFGSDANDFDNNRVAQVSFEDSYLNMWETDGEEWTTKLRQRFECGKSGQSTPREAKEWLARRGGV